MPGPPGGKHRHSGGGLVDGQVPLVLDFTHGSGGVRNVPVEHTLGSEEDLGAGLLKGVPGEGVLVCGTGLATVEVEDLGELCDGVGGEVEELGDVG